LEAVLAKAITDVPYALLVEQEEQKEKQFLGMIENSHGEFIDVIEETDLRTGELL